MFFRSWCGFSLTSIKRYLFWVMVSLPLLYSTPKTALAEQLTEEQKYQLFDSVPDFRLLRCESVRSLKFELCNNLPTFIYFEMLRANVLINWRYLNLHENYWQ